MTSIHRELETIIADIMKQGNYPYAEKYIGKPSIPIFLVKMVCLIMQSYAVPRETIHRYCVAITLLQMGIDTHDRVSVGEERTLHGKRSRQLLVLAGDYYSGLFYRLLTEKGDMAAIRKLSEAVCDIHEAKMELYGLHRKKSTLQSPLSLLRRIRGSLVRTVAELFHPTEEKNNPWIPFVENAMVVDYLLGNEMQDQYDGLAESLATEVLQTIPKIEPANVHQELVRQIHHRLAPVLQGQMVHEG